MNLYYKIKNTIRDSWYDFRCRCQRFKCGYSYSDVWDMDYWFMNTVKPMLIHLRDHGSSVPMEFENNEKGWHDTLTDMVCCLNMMDRDQVYRELGFDNMRNMTREDYDTAYNIMEKNKNEFFELFSKYFYTLWD